MIFIHKLLRNKKPNLKNPELHRRNPKYCGATNLERWASTLLEVTGFLSDFIIYVSFE
jgi:hypothetical protein